MQTNNHVSYNRKRTICGSTMLQKLPVNTFEQRKDTFILQEDFLRNYDLDSEKKMLSILSIYMNHTMICHSYQKERKQEASETCV